MQTPVDESGKPIPLGHELAVTPLELVSMFRASQEVQHRILGKDEDEGVYEFHYHFNAYDPKYDHEQPAAVLAARRKARELTDGNGGSDGSGGTNGNYESD
jgi:hypothetical protein